MWWSARVTARTPSPCQCLRITGAGPPLGGPIVEDGSRAVISEVSVGHRTFNEARLDPSESRSGQFRHGLFEDAGWRRHPLRALAAAGGPPRHRVHLSGPRGMDRKIL